LAIKDLKFGRLALLMPFARVRELIPSMQMTTVGFLGSAYLWECSVTKGCDSAHELSG
jgi:hypothetical protein